MSVMHCRFYSDRPSQRLQRLVAPTQSVQRTAEIVVRWGMVWANVDCPAQAIFSLVMPPLDRRSYTQIEMAFGIAGLIANARS